MSKIRPVHLIMALVWVGAAALAFAVMRQPHPPKATVQWTPPPATPTPTHSSRHISAQELAANDGKNGHKCYVAVNGLVYVIPTESIDWKDGQHVPSNGLVYCSKDVSGEISKSPHGAGVLSSLEVVGSL